MSFKKRNLIVFQSPEIGNGIYNELSAHDWDVYVAEDIQQATELLDKHIFKVGLCLIGKCTSTQKLKRKIQGGSLLPSPCAVHQNAPVKSKGR